MSLDLGDLVGRISLDSSHFDQQLDRLPGNIKSTGKVMAGGALLVGAAVAVALGKGLNDAINFDASNRTVAAQLGLTATESARVGTLAGKLYAENYGESVEQVQGAIGNVMAGIRGMGNESDAVVSDMTAKVLNYASAYGVESADAIQMVSGLLGSGLATSAQNAMDLMTAAMQSVPEALRGDMVDAITEYGPFLASLGYDGEEAFSVLASAAEKGMYGIDKTGDALKEFTIRATDMSTASKVGYDLLGMSQEEMSAKLLAGGDAGAAAFQQIIAGLTTMTDPLAQSQAALALFGTPLEDLGVDQIPRFLDAIQDSTGVLGEVEGAAQKAGDVMGGSAAASMETFTRKGEIMLAALMSGLLPGITELFDYLNDNPDVLKAVAIGMGIVTVAVLAATAAMWAMSLTPVALIIGGIVIAVGLLAAGVVLLVQNWDAVISWATSAWGGFVGWLIDGLNGLASWWTGLWDGMVEGVSAGFEAVMAWLGGIPGAIGAFFAGIGSWLVQTGTDLLAGFLGGITAGYEAVAAWFASIPAALGVFFAAAGQWLLDVGHNILVGLATGIALGVIAVWFFFTQLPTIIANMLIGAAVWLIQTGTDILNGLAAGITAGYVAVAAWFTALPGVILDFLVMAAVLLYTKGIEFLEGMQRGIIAGYQAVYAWFVALPGVILAFLVASATLLYTKGKEFLDGLQRGIVTGYQTVSAWFIAMPGVILGYLVAAATLLINTGKSLLDGLASGITTGYTAVVTFFTSLPGWIAGMLSSAGSWLVGAGRSTLGGMSTGLSNGWGAVTSFIGGIPGNIIGAFSGAGSWLVSAGRNVVDGLMSGLRSMAGSVGSFFLNLLPGWIVGPFKAALGIHSPSKVFAGFGVNIGEGLIGGLDGIQGDLDRRMSEMVTVPPVDVALRLGSSAANAAGYGINGSAAGTGAAGATVTVDARTTIQGNVGWDRDELEAETNQRQLDALALAGLGTVGI